MGKQGTIASGFTRVILPNGRSYDGGQVWVLSDADYARVPQDMQRLLVGVTTVPDPASPGTGGGGLTQQQVLDLIGGATILSTDQTVDVNTPVDRAGQIIVQSGDDPAVFVSHDVPPALGAPTDSYEATGWFLANLGAFGPPIQFFDTDPGVSGAQRNVSQQLVINPTVNPALTSDVALVRLCDAADLEPTIGAYAQMTIYGGVLGVQDPIVGLYAHVVISGANVEQALGVTEPLHQFQLVGSSSHPSTPEAGSPSGDLSGRVVGTGDLTASALTSTLSGFDALSAAHPGTTVEVEGIYVGASLATVTAQTSFEFTGWSNGTPWTYRYDFQGHLLDVQLLNPKDTGWRDVSNHYGLNFRSILVRRSEVQGVQLSINPDGTADPTALNSAIPGLTLPQGYAPDPSVGHGIVTCTAGDGTAVGLVLVDASGVLSVPSGSVVSGYGRWDTQALWPTVLYGGAV